MYASVRQYTINPGHERVNEAAREVQAGLGPIIRQEPGFVAYYVLDAGSNLVAPMQPTGWLQTGQAAVNLVCCEST